MTATARSPEGLMPSGENQADFDFSAYLAKTRNLVEGALDAALGPERPESLRESMRYSLLAGGSDSDRSSVLPPVSLWVVMPRGDADGSGSGNDPHHVADP